MPRLVNDLTNKKFGYLVALELLNESNHNRTRLWLCKCDCGNLVKRPSTKLVSNEIRSCGCKEHDREVRTAPTVSGFNALYKRYKGAARKRKLDFNLTQSQFKELTQNACFYCGRNPTASIQGSGGRLKDYGSYVYNGIDRIDNSKGYHRHNCVTACKDCNLAKRDRSLQDYRNWIILSYNNLQQGQVKALV